MVSSYFVATVAVLASATQIAAHGLISDPPSRAWFCGYISKPDEQSPKYPTCKDAFNAPGLDPNQAYNYMSMATHELGFQVNGPKKTVCSYESDFFQGKPTWTDQPIDWPTADMTSGSKWFTWDITWGPHFDDTMEFAHWITKPGFVYTVGKALTWDDFDTSAPFCLEKYNDKSPSANPNVVPDKTKVTFKVKCEVPARSGHHVIKGEWGRLPPTNERFHSCVDAKFAGGAQSPSPAVSPKTSPATSPKTSPATSPKTSPATSPKTSPATSPSPSGPCATINNQCGGSTWKGPTCCQTGVCTVRNAYYSQCV